MDMEGLKGQPSSMEDDDDIAGKKCDDGQLGDLWGDKEEGKGGTADDVGVEVDADGEEEERLCIGRGFLMFCLCSPCVCDPMPICLFQCTTTLKRRRGGEGC